PSVAGAENAVKSAAAEMKKAGMLSPATDVSDLANRAFVHLDGVTDDWIQSLQVERLADGQVPPDQDIRLAAVLAANEGGVWVATGCAPRKKRTATSRQFQWWPTQGERRRSP